ncbi:MAG: MetQ/NlpA family ABC transporter substrate-binding protein [Spirochaetales bacterium]|nr:MetQ/NlpA family ABC transporter substrate-binding protein [Spirochaetales bacterium]
MNRRLLVATLLIVVTLSASGGGRSEVDGEPAPVRVALLPVLDTLPFHVALADGLFEERGVAVEYLPVNSSVDRDQLLQAGEADIVIAELMSAALFNREAQRVRVIATARRPRDGDPIFRILAPPGSALSNPADLAGVSIAVSKNNIIEYVTDRVLTSYGLTADDIVTASVPVIPERFQLLMAAQVEAATLPDPLAQAALAAGAVEIANDAEHSRFSQSVLVASAPFVEEHASTVDAFLDAWYEGAARLNGRPHEYTELVFEAIPIPGQLREGFRLARFEERSVPASSEWDDAGAWLVEKGLLAEIPPFAEAVWEP